MIEYHIELSKIPPDHSITVLQNRPTRRGIVWSWKDGGRGCSWKEAFAVRMLNMKLVTMAKVWKLKMKVETYCLFQICVPTIRMPRMFSTSSFNGYRNNRLQIIEFRYFTLKVLNSKMKSLSKLEQWIMNIFSLRSNLNFKKRLAIELELQIGKL